MTLEHIVNFEDVSMAIILTCCSYRSDHVTGQPLQSNCDFLLLLLYCFCGNLQKVHALNVSTFQNWGFATLSQLNLTSS